MFYFVNIVRYKWGMIEIDEYKDMGFIYSYKKIWLNFFNLIEVLNLDF